ncbi:hypothetical protein AUEXF2481DRAFT_26697 [Aureobasidium subglaciale EXF-2481]|uniref:F-box domain-containing protein n=1 Tax=Aureobasidium subglaciale (strain EXF-2481) TaxID=1043005 RepID=A0A074YQ75_AURSE|nr:uncharacterized protein AUEXF2481DRAFT_26697 [Aureobasidium subglaciale EXF-2481]KEQ98314.1 hypothetical protein AUEXF2481DRAFT_26697 [Aureobasidium subglaciale EXF-2481]
MPFSSLPQEMVGKIFEFVDADSLLQLRFVSGAMSRAANKQFACTFFGSSHHVATEQSISTLLAVSAHGVFAPYMKTIMISPARQILAYNTVGHHDEDAIVENSYVESSRFNASITRVLANIKEKSGRVTLAIHEDRRLEMILPEQHYRSSHNQQCHGARAFVRASPCGLAYRTGETLELVMAAARQTGIHVQRLHIQLSRDAWERLKHNTQLAIERLDVVGVGVASTNAPDGTLSRPHSMEEARRAFFDLV